MISKKKRHGKKWLTIRNHITIFTIFKAVSNLESKGTYLFSEFISMQRWYTKKKKKLKHNWNKVEVRSTLNVMFVCFYVFFYKEKKIWNGSIAHYL